MTVQQQNITAFPAFARLAPRLVAAGYSAVPIGAGAKYPVGLDEWQHYCENQPSQGDIDFFAQDMPAAGLGLPNGRFTVAYDFDHQAAIDAVFALMPWTPVAKTGQKGFTLIYRQNPDHRELPRKFKSKRDAEGKRHMLVEVLSTGSQTVLPPTMHPDIQRPYQWCNPWGAGETHPLWDIPLAELPTVPAFLWSTIERRLVEAGLVDDPFAEMQARAERLARAPKLKAEFETMRHRFEPWLEKRLTLQADGLAKLSEGRHDALYRAACAMGPFVGAGLIEEAKVEAALFQACLANGFFDRDKVVRSSTKKEFHRQFERGIAWGETQPLAELEERYFRDMPPPEVMKEATVTSILRAEKASDILARKPKPRKWAVDQWVPGDNVTLLVGDGGTGKSLLVLLLLACIATGTPFFGIPVVTGPALYISAEDEQDEIDRRVHAIHAKMPGVDLSRLHCISLDAYPEPAIFAYDARGKPAATALLATIEAEIIRLKPKVVGLDPLADLYACDEVKRPEVRAFISALRRIARAHQCAIILLAHPSVEGMKSNRGYSGSTAWNNSVRSRLLFGRPRRTDDDDAGQDDDDWRELSLEKSNRSKIGGRIKMKWVDGVFVQGADNEAFDQMNRQLKAESIFMALLKLHNDQSRDVSPSYSAKNYAPTIFADHPNSQGITKKGFKSAMEILLTANKVSVETIGREKDGKKRLIVCHNQPGNALGTLK